MYLCDRSIRDLLQAMRFEVEEGAEPFRPEEQVQPASIDLRLGSLFWKPQKRFAIDLRRSKLLEIQPRRYYRRQELRAGDTIVLNPGDLLLGRTCEAFTIPNGYAADLTGRSSFARLGLMVTAAGGFINPGWRGRMPLQLVNLSPNAIRLVPGLPICQIRLIKLTDSSETPYGSPDLESKYMNDDGGPSYWWRDKRIKKLHGLLSEKRVEDEIQQRVDQFIGTTEPEIIERLEEYVRRLRLEELQNADALLEGFALSEDRRRSLRRWGINVSRGSFTLGITVSLWMANRSPIEWLHYVVWAIAVALIGLSIYAFRTEAGDHFGMQELRKKQAAQ